jgi:hypothetical protein
MKAIQFVFSMLDISGLRYKPILQIPAVIITLGLMWLLPFLIHLIPFTGIIPLGARLLPIFYAPLLAAWLFHPVVGIFSSLLMPFINHAFTGMPAFNVAMMLSVELCIFSFVLTIYKNRYPRLPLIAPFAVIAGKFVSALLLFIIPLVPFSPWEYFSSSIFNAIPGLLVVLAINLALNRLTNN